MSEQALDLGTSLRILRQHKPIVGIVAALGLSAGVAFAMLKPPMFTSQAEVALSSSSNIATQVFVASSSPVLTQALRQLDSPMSLQALRSRVRSKRLTPTIVSISAQGETPAQAEDIANAVANSYIVFIGSTDSPGLRTRAAVLQPATSGTGTPLNDRLLVTGLLGALLGLLIGAIVVLATNRNDRRLQERDEIAGSIGIPVLTSISVSRPSNARGWARLLEDYQPGDVDAWRLRMTLYKLGLTELDGTVLSVGGVYSLAVLSLSSDPKALALGPQLAVFAASLGIPTVLIVGPQQDVNTTAMLRAACAALPTPSRGSRKLQVTVNNRHDADMLRGARLTVVVAVVDGQNPEVALTIRATATVLGVSAGAVTARQLARVAAAAAADGRDMVGVFVADPDPQDCTTGRVQELAPPAHQHRTPIRLGGMFTDSE
jgi:capsular polysaccharide biosynthesis protein